MTTTFIVLVLALVCAAAAAVLLNRRDRRTVSAEAKLGLDAETLRTKIADELCSPLTSIVGYLELVRDGSVGPLADEQRMVLDKVSRHADYLTAIVDSLLELTTIDPLMMIGYLGRQQRTAKGDPVSLVIPHDQQVIRAPRAASTLTGSSAVTEPWSIDGVIDDRAVRTVFQPVVHLASGEIAGFEALSRGPAGSTLEAPAALLAAAKLAGRLGELDWLCRAHALQAAVAAGLDRNLSWLINVEPAGLAIPCPEHLLEGLSTARHALRVILEVVERDVEGYATDLLHATDQARRDSWGVALDDIGVQEDSLALLPFLRPDVVKLDMCLVQAAPEEEAAAVTAAVRAYAESTGAVILAEGIETEEQERLARVFGATYGQGYRYGRPGPLPVSVPRPTHAIPLRQQLVPLDGRTPFEVLTSTAESQRAPKAQLLHISRHLEAEAELGNHASVLLTSFQDCQYFTEAKRRRFEQLARSSALTVVVADGLDTYDEPHFHVGPLLPGSRLGEEWAVIVIKPHYAAAFVGRDCGDNGADGERRFDFVYTHDRDAVIAAARSYMQELAPLSTGRTVLAGVVGADHPAVVVAAAHPAQLAAAAVLAEANAIAAIADAEIAAELQTTARRAARRDGPSTRPRPRRGLWRRRPKVRGVRRRSRPPWLRPTSR